MKSLVHCNVIKPMQQKSLEFLLESWGAVGGPNIYRKAIPSWGTNNTESPLAKLQGCSWGEEGVVSCYRLTADLGVLW